MINREALETQGGGDFSAGIARGTMVVFSRPTRWGNVASLCTSISKSIKTLMVNSATLDLPPVLSQLDRALAEKKITSSSATMIRRWLTEPRFADYAGEVAAHIAAGKWKELDDVFWTVIPFGTGGRRGKMYPIGSNAINDRTIGESAQGVADYVRSHLATGENTGGNTASRSLGCSIAYDTRHNSRHFAELCAGNYGGRWLQSLLS